MEKDTGGTAFPLPLGSETVEGQEGMTLRDYFAAKAMQGVMGSGTAMQIGTNHREAMLDMAVALYSMADAMLEARDRALGQ